MSAKAKFCSACRNVVHYLLTAACFLFVIFLRLTASLYSWRFAHWAAHPFDLITYAVALCFLLALIRPGASAARIAKVAVGICFGVEFLQLWHPMQLEVWRAGVLGRLIVGSS